MSWQLLKSLLPGNKPTPRAAMNFIQEEVEKKIGKVSGFKMSVDFVKEEIYLQVPEKNIGETIKNSMIFNLFKLATEAEFSGYEMTALIVDFKKESPSLVEYYYTDKGEKLKGTKTI